MVLIHTINQNIKRKEEHFQLLFPFYILSRDTFYFFITFLMLSNIDFITMSPCFCFFITFYHFLPQIVPVKCPIIPIHSIFPPLTNAYFATLEHSSNFYEAFSSYHHFSSLYRDISSFFLTFAHSISSIKPHSNH